MFAIQTAIIAHIALIRLAFRNIAKVKEPSAEISQIVFGRRPPSAFLTIVEPIARLASTFSGLFFITIQVPLVWAIWKICQQGSSRDIRAS